MSNLARASSSANQLPSNLSFLKAVPTTTTRLAAEIKGARSLNRITSFNREGIYMIRIILLKKNGFDYFFKKHTLLFFANLSF